MPYSYAFRVLNFGQTVHVQASYIMIVRVRSPENARKRILTPKRCKSPDLSRTTTETVHRRPLEEEIREKLSRKSVECDDLERELQRCLERENSLQDEIVELRQSRQQPENREPNKIIPSTHYIKIEQPSFLVYEQNVELRKQLRQLKDSLLQKSSIFNRMEQMLLQNQSEMVAIVSRNRHLQQLVRHQQLLIQELMQNNERWRRVGTVTRQL